MILGMGLMRIVKPLGILGRGLDVLSSAEGWSVFEKLNHHQ
jgi:hypothetical protein